jgi:hypothetical protein
VQVDKRSPEFAELSSKLDEVIRLLGQSNQIVGETRDQLIAEIGAGRLVLASPRPDRSLVQTRLVHPLTWIIAAAGAGIVGTCASDALHLLIQLVDNSAIPL